MATLLDLKTRVRQRADKVNSTYISDSELTNYINGSYAELYDLVVDSYEDYFIAGPTSFSLSSSDNGVYALPSSFYKLKGVDYSYGGTWVTVSPYTWADRNRHNQVSNPLVGPHRSYRLVGSNLRIEPDDGATGDYRVWYVPSYTALSSDADVLDTIITRNNWEEYIVIDAAIKILAKEESNTAHLVYEKREMRQRIIDAAGERDVDQPESVSDVRRPSYETL